MEVVEENESQGKRQDTGFQCDRLSVCLSVCYSYISASGPEGTSATNEYGGDAEDEEAEEYDDFCGSTKILPLGTRRLEWEK